jgi:putative transposase
MDVIRALNHFLAVLFVLILDTIRFLSQSLRSCAALSAENLFLRRQLALYAERKVKARRANDGARLAMVLLSRFFAWKGCVCQ